jgi:hypothetical protein
VLGSGRPLSRPPCPLMIDGICRNGQSGHRGQYGTDRHQKEHGPLREPPADPAGESRDSDIARMIEGRVAAETPGQVGPSIEAERQCCHDGPKHVANDGDGRVGDHHRPEGRQRKDGQCAKREHGQGRNDQRPLGACGVDRCTYGRLYRQAQQPAHRRHDTDRGLAPVLLCYQKNVEKRAERAAHIGEQEVQRVERGGMKAPANRTSSPALHR